MVSCFGDPSVGGVSGHIVFKGEGDDEAPHLGTYWRYEKWIRRNLTRLDSLLVVTGCLFAIRGELAEPLPEDSLADDALMPLSIVVRGYRVVHEPGAVAYEVPTALQTDFPRKMRTLAGLYQLIRDYPRLLGPSNRLWFHFWSYKLGRLVLPFALLAMAVASFWLPEPGRACAVGGQALFYALAMAHPWIPQGWVLARCSVMARTFVVLMVASLCAISVLFVPARMLWKESRVEREPAKSKAASGSA
jgi:cellulose synthase/poly-beta-1,6-N-acetylglucosamine synthase-like glycosyltransferase